VEALGHAVKTGLINRNIALYTEPPKVEHKIIPTLAPDQLDKFFSAVKGMLYYALFYLMLHTGLRRGEALALKWKHIDLGLSSLGVSAYLSVTQSLNKVEGRALVQEPKTASGKRRVALSASLALVLRQYREAQEAMRMSVGELTDENYVCCHLDGAPLDPSTVSHAFAKVLRRAGLPPMPPYMA